MKILIIESRFYSKIADELLSGATLALDERSVAYEIISISGALEIPQILAAAIQNKLFQSIDDELGFDGCVVLGCVIRGETSHYDIVVNESARSLSQLATEHGIALGNGILTVENETQALVRASITRKNKGRDACNACLDVISIQRQFKKRLLST